MTAGGSSSKDKAREREAKLAQALRANLRRRKAERLQPSPPAAESDEGDARSRGDSA